MWHVQSTLMETYRHNLQTALLADRNGRVWHLEAVGTIRRTSRGDHHQGQG